MWVKREAESSVRRWLSHFRSMIMVTRIRVGEVRSEWMPRVIYYNGGVGVRRLGTLGLT